jgi:predicted RNA binding protein YcfA (HicA-like mRNA interferase family)
MKRTDLIKHLHEHGCEFVREGGSHTIYRNPANGKRTTIPRHNEINDITAERICKTLEVPKP